MECNQTRDESQGGLITHQLRIMALSLPCPLQLQSAHPLGMQDAPPPSMVDSK